DSDSAFESVRPQIEKNVVASMRDGETDPYALQQITRRTVGRWVSSTLKGRPMIVPVVITT
ncbi:MAG: RNase J family beta-CASP ribonuclease, partial [Propionibacteriaceae bacterium]|nr:RNase J family beta-CASP ribonuclease [Propionibacteriaceae bacterium]